MDDYSLQFLPNLRLGLGANAQQTADKLHRIKDVDVILVNQSDESIKDQDNNPIESKHSTKLIGPGDVIGFNSRVVARTAPDNNTNDFEPNYVPFVEFKDPDFPWRYSLGDKDNRLNPWIVLLVLTRDAFILKRTKLNKKQYINTIELNDKGIAQLPDLENAWAWAHVQLSGGESFDSDEKKLVTSLRNNPEWNCSRILCLRKLEPLTLYSAFVVPWYEAGRLAVGLSEGKTVDDSCWKEPNTLPVYYHWEFQTSEKGDFEDLINRIKAEECPSEVGKRKIDGAHPRYLPDSDYGTFELEGALLPLGNDVSHDAESEDFSDAVAEQLRRVTFIDDPEDTEDDPLITIPFYGQHYQKTDVNTFNSTNTTDWRMEINLNRGYRTPAGMGTQVVQKNQEEYMDLCWKQVTEVRAANEELRRAAIGVLIGERLQTRHLDHLSDERFLTITEPFHHYVENGASNLKSQLAKTGMPEGLLTYPMRRVFAQKTRFADSKIGLQRTYAGYLQSRIYHNQQPSGEPHPSETAKKLFFSASPLWGDKATISQLTGEGASNIKSIFKVEKDILDRLNAMISKGEGRPSITKIEPIMCAPELSFAMYDYLEKFSTEYLLPNLKELKNNTVVCGRENRKFIEAYMVGLNHEMGRELVWREYPTDRKGTIFYYFWEPANDKQLSIGDIKPINDWKIFGENANESKNVSNSEERTIFVVKADLIRRYPDSIFYAVYTDESSPSLVAWKDFLNANAQNGTYKGFKLIEPEIRATINNDICLLGFPVTPQEIKENPANYFFVIEQMPSLPNFGLDNEKKESVAEFDDLSWEDFELDDKGWLDPTKKQYNFTDEWSSASNTGAVVAQFFLQSPVRLVFPAIKMLPPKPEA